MKTRTTEDGDRKEEAEREAMFTELLRDPVKAAQDDARRRVAREAFVKFWTVSLEANVDNLSRCDPKALAYDAAWRAFRAGCESVAHGH